MIGGVGYSWFKLTLVDETRNYKYLTGILQENELLEGVEDREIHLEGVENIYRLQGTIEPHKLAGVLKHYQFSGTLGGGEGE